VNYSVGARKHEYVEALVARVACGLDASIGFTALDDGFALAVAAPYMAWLVWRDARTVDVCLLLGQV
jgi:hypothetical protein